jgi:heat-inducible transcriptional repressor
MEISERQETILENVIGEYIDCAHPVSSFQLGRKYRFGLCPASIRTEMQKLTEMDYLFQPHCSAGRVPTDKGYRFFVNRLLKRKRSDFSEARKIKRLLIGEENVFKLISRLTKVLAGLSSGLVVAWLPVFPGGGLFFKEGWSKILEKPEFDNKKLTIGFIGFLKNFERAVSKLKVGTSVEIYIGREIPFEKSDDFSLILSEIDLPKGERGVVSILGPKRMAYEKDIGLVDSLNDFLVNL